METCNTQGCGRHYLDATGLKKFCHRCRKALQQAAQCPYCGAALDSNAQDTCTCAAQLKQLQQIATPQYREDAPRAKYRGPDQREDTYQTKYGS